MIYDRYEQYERRMRILARILAWIKKYYKTVILPPVGLLCATLIFLGVVGTFTEAPSISSITYGDPLSANAKAFLSSVSYQYQPEGETVWYEGLPETIGTYTARAVSKTGYGKPRYSETTAFAISPAQLELECTTTACLYGTENETVNQNIRAVGLVNGDRLAEEVYTILGYSETGVTVQIESFVILGQDGSDRTFCYSRTPSSDFVTLQPRSVTLTADAAQKTYDGKPLVGAPPRVTEGSLAKGDTLMVNEEISITKTGSVEYNPSVSIVNEDGRDVTHFYNLNRQGATLTVVPRPITVTTSGAERQYDGTPLLNSELKVTKGSLVEGDTLSATAAPEITYVGSIANERIASVTSADGLNVTDQYEITYEYGALTVTKRPITYTTGTAERQYDGTPLSDNTIKIVKGSLATGDVLNASPAPEITLVGSIENERTITIVAPSGRDVTDQYDISHSFGTLTVTKRPITIATGSAERQYDGTPLFNDHMEITKGSLAAGETLQGATPITITNVGTIPNTRMAIITSGTGQTVTNQYEITYEYGTLTVTKRPITVTTGSAEKKADGKPLSCEEFSITSGSLAKGDSLILTEPVVLEYPGEAENKLEFAIVNGMSADVAFNYEVTYEYGTLRIIPWILRFKTGSAEKVYDGTPLHCPDYTFLSGELAPGHRIANAKTVSTPINAGSYPNDIAVTVVDQQGQNITKLFYQIEVDAGRLVIHQREVEFSTGSASKVYDGTPLTCEQWRYSNSDLLKSHEITNIKVTGSQTEIGMSPNTFEWQIIDFNTKEDVTRNYKAVPGAGTLWVQDPNGEPPDGEEMEGAGGSEETPIGGPMNPDDRDPRVYLELKGSFDQGTIYLREKSLTTYKFDSWGAGEPCSLKFSHNPLFMSGTQANLTSDWTSYSIRLILKEYCPDVVPYFVSYSEAENRMIGGNDIALTVPSDDYTVRTYPYITLQQFAETTRKNSWVSKEEPAYRKYVYDTYLQIPESTKQAMLSIVKENNLSTSNKVQTILNVQDYVSNAAIYKLDFKGFPAGVDQAVYFLTTLKEGYCQHFATSATMMYRALGIPARYTVGFSASIPQNARTVEVTGREKHAWVEIYLDGTGWIPVEVTASSEHESEGGGGGSGYIEDAYGRTVIDINTYSLHKYYDSRPFEEYTGDTYWISRGQLLPGHRLEITNIGSPSKYFVGLGRATPGNPRIKVVDAYGNDVTKQYKINLNLGDYRIEQRPITITTGSASAVYNAATYSGEPLVCNEWWISSGSLAEGHEIEVTVTGTATLSGTQIAATSTNTFQVKITDQDGKDVTRYYNITKKQGTLKMSIEKRSITITSASATAVYNGTPLRADEWWISSGSLANGHTITVKVTGSVSLYSPTSIASTSKNRFTVTIRDQSGKIVNNFYNITYDYGTLRVTRN